MNNDIYDRMFDEAFTPEVLLQGYNSIKKMIDGEEVGINPLEEIPEPQMTLYGVNGMFFSKYFDTEEELKRYLLTQDAITGNRCKIEYLGNAAGKNDVIRITYESKEGNLYTVSDEDGYGVYNQNRSVYTGTFIWEYNHGSLRDEYEAFKKRGIILENDLYGRLESLYKSIKRLDGEEEKIRTLKK